MGFWLRRPSYLLTRPAHHRDRLRFEGRKFSYMICSEVLGFGCWDNFTIWPLQLHPSFSLKLTVPDEARPVPEIANKQ